MAPSLLPISTPASVAPSASVGADASLDEAALRELVAEALRGRYRLLECLGEGGMSVVYAAEDAALGRPVALKVLRPAFRHRIEDRERFRREARVLARLDHPGIVTMYALDEAAGLPCFTLRWVRGGSLAQRLERDGRLSVADTIRLLADLADALVAVHRAGIVHRDLKPANVLLEAADARPVLIDFGVAIVGTSDHSRADVMHRFGTPGYMSPEQALGEVDCGPAGDLYSLGVLGFQLLAGRLPFQGRTARDVVLQHIARSAARVSTFRPEVPAALDVIIARCLAKDPGERWPDAAALRDALRAAALEGGRPQRRLTGFVDRLLGRSGGLSAPRPAGAR